MIECKKVPKNGYFVYFEVSESGGIKAGGGLDYCFNMTRDGEGYSDMLLRAIINSLEEKDYDKIYTEDVWGFDLVPFGFHGSGEVFVAEKGALKLPKNCGGSK